MKEPSVHTDILKGLDALYLQQYKRADSLLENTGMLSDAAALYFRGLAKCVRFNDLGDTAALTQAGQLWKRLVLKVDIMEKTARQPRVAVPPELYRGLALLQLAYVSSVRHKPVEALSHSRKGIRQLKEFNGYLETQCYLHIYEYYKKKLMDVFSWIPFVSLNKIPYRQFLKNNFSRSHYLYGVFLVPLVWFHFDAGLYKEGLVLSRQFLQKFPDNRIFRAIEADFLYKLGRYREAAELFEALKSEYLAAHTAYGRPCVRVNFLSICGNLVRVYAALGDREKQRTNTAIWFSLESESVGPWLPKSLVKDLERFDPKQ